jgi:hypothetical protein
MIIDFKNIDFTKYKRFFVFGCSFTEYRWPTWANVLSTEMPTVDFYNFGHCGGGNSMISNRITEANCRFNFTETDLVIPMWTTFCREDRFKFGSWLSVGNIFSQHEYSEDFVKKYCDPKGYLLRDLAIITITSAYLKNLPCDSFTLASVPYNYQMIMDDKLKPTPPEILDVYKDTINLTPPALIDLELDGEFKYGHTYKRKDSEEIYIDYHPHTLNYYNYLSKIGLPLTNKSLEYTEKSMELLKSTTTEIELHECFRSMHWQKNIKVKSLF